MLERKGVVPYLYLAPALLLMILFIVYPIFSSFSYSFHTWSGLGAMKFVGLDNYWKLLGADREFWGSLKVTFIWVILSITVLTVTSLILAVIVEFGVRMKRMVAFTRTVLFIPMVMSLVSIGMLWSLIYNPILGMLSKLLGALGLVDPMAPLDMLGNYSLAIYAVFIPVLWQWSGFGMVVFSAAMQGIPGEILEASTIDGCGRLKQIRHIVLPLMKPTIALLTTLNLIGAFKAFDIIYVMTAGGPGGATMVTTIYMFRQAFINNSFGYSSTISVVMFIIALVFGLIAMKYSEKTQNYI